MGRKDLTNDHFLHGCSVAPFLFLQKDELGIGSDMVGWFGEADLLVTEWLDRKAWKMINRVLGSTGLQK